EFAIKGASRLRSSEPITVPFSVLEHAKRAERGSHPSSAINERKAVDSDSWGLSGIYDPHPPEAEVRSWPQTGEKRDADKRQELLETPGPGAVRERGVMA